MFENTILKIIYKGAVKQGNVALNKLYSIAPNAVQYSNDLLKKLLNENKDTVYGKKYGFENIGSYEEYKEKVPLTDYADYRELVERISDGGEQNILTAEPVVHFCPTTGTTSAPKLIPIVNESKQLSTDYTLPACMTIIDKALKSDGKPGITKGKGIFCIEIGELSKSPSGITIGGVSGTSVRENIKIIEKISASPREVITPDAYLDSKYIHALFALKDRNITWMASCYMTTLAGIMDCIETRWQDICDDIENGKLHDDVEMSDKTRESLNRKLTADPERANELRAIFANGFGEPVIPKIWKDFCFVAAIGSGSFKIHKEKVKRFTGEKGVRYCNLVISSSETLVAVADGCDSEDFILVPQAAFFEFIPENDSGSIKTIGELKVGERYEVVVSTISGLYRYRLYDIVEVTGFLGQLPKLKFSHRANVFLNVAGEKTTEADLQRAINYFSEKTGIKVSDYCAFPDFSTEPGCYTVLVEPDETVDKSRISEYEKILEEGLCQTFGYEYERKVGNICPAKFILQQRMTHVLYRELQIMKGKSSNQLKPVRVLKTPEMKAFFLKLVEE